MLLQISSGQGPEECSVAVEKLAATLQKEYRDLQAVACYGNPKYQGFRSVLMESALEHPELQGTVQWIWQSELRPGHKRKNWFINMTIIPEQMRVGDFDEKDCRFETFRSGGKGGQNVNKVETGIRIIHVPTEIKVECTEERSQYLNKQKGLRRLQAMLAAQRAADEARQNNDAWDVHNNGLERGNPVRVYEGGKFKRVK